MSESKADKYPRQIFSTGRKNVIFGIDAFLGLPADDAPPLETPGYSRFVCTLVDKAGAVTKTPFANIPESEIALIKRKFDFSTEMLMLPKQPAAQSSDVGLAGSVVLNLNNYKGKTPLAILKANPGEKNGLIQARDFLARSSNAKFAEQNKQQMQAIDEALALLESGKLKDLEVGTEGQPVYLYRTDYRFLKSKKKDDLYMIYAIGILFNPSRNNPYEVIIVNGFAPVETMPDKTARINLKGIRDKIEGKISLTENECAAMIESMVSTANAFKNTFFGCQWAKSQKITKKWREKNVESFNETQEESE